MCLAVPVQIISIDENMMATCRVGEGETCIHASLMLMDEEVGVNDYLIVHAGFALRKLDMQEAQETITILREMVRLVDQKSGREE
ncbi:MAG: HypC/HybG/HupF family hydrogenase formation chaperone [Desulfovibrionales bacterium]